MNSNSSFLGTFLGASLWEMSLERRQDAFRADYRVRAVDELWSHRRSLRRQHRRSSHDLRETVSRDGVCAADMAPEFARHRGDPWRQREQNLCDGFASQHSSLDTGRCERSARLAHLVGRRCTTDSLRSQALQRNRFARTRLEEHRLRTGRNHDQSLVFEPLRRGSVSQSQGRGQASHLANLRGAIPAFIHISDGKMHEVNVLDFMPIEAGAFYVMDLGYLDFTRIYALHQAGGFS